jgi:hypothetical protein
MKIIIPTCNNYCNILEANQFSSMNSFNSPNLEVIILGYEKPNFDLGSWKFISLGEDRGAQNFTNDIIPFFENFNEEYFIYGNDDCIFTNKINLEFLNEIIENVKEMPNFGRMWLTQTPSNFYGGSKRIRDFGKYQIGEIGQNSDYRLSLQYSIWKTSYFKKYLIPNINPWEWEIRETAKNDGMAILLPLNNFVISVGHVMRQGRYLNDWYRSIYNDGTLDDVQIKVIEEIFKKHNYIK